MLQAIGPWATAMLPLEEALGEMVASVCPLVPLRKSLLESDGCVLAQSCVSNRTKPPFDTSAMDGYALPSTPLAGKRFEVVGEVPAGGMFDGFMEQGHAVRIFTGAPVPDGAKHIIIQEDVERHGDTIAIKDGMGKGANIRPRGGDFVQDDLLIDAGVSLTPQHLALAASGDHASLLVHPRPRVAILMNGDELALPGIASPDTAIIASNGYGLAALAKRFGADVVSVDLLPDDQSRIEAWITTTEADVLLTVGGASVGDYDLIHPALDAVGFDVRVPKVALRPGKPTLLGFKGAQTVLGLPGNPVSSMVSAIVFLRPLIERLASKDPYPLLQLDEGKLGVGLAENGPRAHFMRAIHDGDGSLVPVESQDSSLLRLLADADVLLYRAAHAPAANTGSKCSFLSLPQ
ncbi:MAG: molybdopterin molybdotransferase MoeA [Pseudomonadota bacterium]